MKGDKEREEICKTRKDAGLNCNGCQYKEKCQGEKVDFVLPEDIKPGTKQANRFVTPFGDGEGKLPVEKGRYRLLWAPVCPWANRSIIVRQLLGLEDVISVGTLDPIRPDVPWSDWAFTLDEGGKDPVLRIHLLSEAYKKADPDYKGRFTVPALVDLRTGTWDHTTYFVIGDGVELKEKWSLKDAQRYAEELK